MSTQKQIGDIEDLGEDCEAAAAGPEEVAIPDEWGREVNFDELEKSLAEQAQRLGRPRMKLKRIAPEVISCSRRTDVPAHYTSGLVKILRRGAVLVSIRGSTSLVSLDPATVKAWVWWSKNYGPWIQAYQAEPQLFERYHAHLFHFTITGLDDLESVGVSLEERLGQIALLSRLGKVVVRFDPITRYRDARGVLRSNQSLMHELVPRFKAAGAHEIEFKFCVPYAGTVSRMAKRGGQFERFPPERKRQIVRELMEVCAAADIPLRACCPEPDEMVEGLEISACVDGEAINEMLGSAGRVGLKKDKGQRAKCKCVEAKDIGSYKMKCPHNCDYCYAQPGPANRDFW